MDYERPKGGSLKLKSGGITKKKKKKDKDKKEKKAISALFVWARASKTFKNIDLKNSIKIPDFFASLRSYSLSAFEADKPEELTLDDSKASESTSVVDKKPDSSDELPDAEDEIEGPEEEEPAVFKEGTVEFVKV